MMHTKILDNLVETVEAVEVTATNIACSGGICQAGQVHGWGDSRSEPLRMCPLQDLQCSEKT